MGGGFRLAEFRFGVKQRNFKAVFSFPEGEAAEFQVFPERYVMLLEMGAAEAFDVLERALEGTFGGGQVALEFFVELALLFVPEAAFRLRVIDKLLYFQKAVLGADEQPLLFGGLADEQ